MFRTLLLLGAVMCCACSGVPVRPPRAEFLVATPDSTYWVSAGRDGVHVRGVPMTIARFGGRFHELYVADLDDSFDDAIFTGERLYMRDLITNDSMLVYDDTAVVRLAARYAREHPNARPLPQDDDDSPEDPDISAQGEIDILDVRGPVVLLEHRSTVEGVTESQSDTTRIALDLHSVRPGVPAQVVLTTSPRPFGVRGTRGGNQENWHDLAPDDVLHDSAAFPKLPYTWQRASYTLIARGDTTDGTTSLMLRDSAQQLWPVLTTGERPRIYWLDTPAVDLATRNALSHAFNSAAAYDEAVKYVRNDQKSSVSARPALRVIRTNTRHSFTSRARRPRAIRRT